MENDKRPCGAENNQNTLYVQILSKNKLNGKLCLLPYLSFCVSFGLNCRFPAPPRNYVNFPGARQMLPAICSLFQTHLYSQQAWNTTTQDAETIHTKWTCLVPPGEKQGSPLWVWLIRDLPGLKSGESFRTFSPRREDAIWPSKVTWCWKLGKDYQTALLSPILK